MKRGNFYNNSFTYLRPPRLRPTIFEHGFRIPTTLVSVGAGEGVPRPWSLIVRMEGETVVQFLFPFSP